MQIPVVFGFETENYGVCVFSLEHSFVSAQSKLVSPFGRDVAQRQRGQAPSLRELGCRLAARLREQPARHDESGELSYEFVRVLPSQSFASQMPALPKGEPRSRCEPQSLTHQANSCADLPACCSFRHGLRRATFLREEGFVYAQTKLVSPFGRDVAQRQRGLAPSYAQTKLVSPSGRDVAQRHREQAPSLRELGCRLAARLREQPARPDELGELLYEFISVLPSQSFAPQMPALPKGEPRCRCEPQS